MARLSVNLNKIALLRNSRRTGVPDLRAFARVALEAGARGITVHPRPDERHIRRSDVPMLAETIAASRPNVELNIEGYPDARLLEIAAEVRPEQCTLVPMRRMRSLPRKASNSAQSRWRWCALLSRR